MQQRNEEKKYAEQKQQKNKYNIYSFKISVNFSFSFSCEQTKTIKTSLDNKAATLNETAAATIVAAAAEYDR